MSHHTVAQVKAAFSRAPDILMVLREAGVTNPSFELFSDASGRLALGKEGQVTEAQLQLAQNLLRSNRPYQTFCQVCWDDAKRPFKLPHKHVIGISFCCGLVPEDMV